MGIDQNTIVKPRFAKLWNHYPAGSPKQAIQAIGGQVEKGWNWNGGWGTCAVRVSRSLNKAGVDVPKNFKLKAGGNILTYEGGDQKRYALRVRELEEWLRHKYGPPLPPIKKDGAKGVSYRPFVGKSGIIIFDPGTGGGSSFGGHVDLWDGQGVAQATYFRETECVRLYEFI